MGTLAGQVSETNWKSKWQIVSEAKLLSGAPVHGAAEVTTRCTLKLKSWTCDYKMHKQT